MTSTVEHIRQQHEDLETLKQLTSKALQSRSDPSVPHPRLHALPFPLVSTTDAEHLASSLLSSCRERAVHLHAFYASEPSHRSLSNAAHSAADTYPLSRFYAALRDLRDTHRSNVFQPSIPYTLVSSTQRDTTLLASYQPAHFSGEEDAGRLLDLQLHFRHFINLTGNVDLLYHQYVRDTIAQTSSVPVSQRWTTAYNRYLLSLFEYLSDFASRAHPLDHVHLHIERENRNVISTLHHELDEITEMYNSPQSILDGLGDLSIKEKLSSLALKCGGRPIDRARRLWNAARNHDFGQATVLHKIIVFLLEQVLCDERAATVANIQNKLSLSYKEIEAERKAAELGVVAPADTHPPDAQEVESTVYNPKDVPLGWDGKPIPYWMYKLHGLNHEFKCEICGGATYKGPRAFERHFTEANHVGGLRRLGISSSKPFMMITGIKDAVRLHERLVNREESVHFDAIRLVEVEDEEGNVMNMKTMNDLKRQGIL